MAELIILCLAATYINVGKVSPLKCFFLQNLCENVTQNADDDPEGHFQGTWTWLAAANTDGQLPDDAIVTRPSYSMKPSATQRDAMQFQKYTLRKDTFKNTLFTCPSYSMKRSATQLSAMQCSAIARQRNAMKKKKTRKNEMITKKIKYNGSKGLS